MTALYASRSVQPTAARSAMRCSRHAAVASALLLAAASPAAADDIGSFFGNVVGGVLGQAMQPRYYQQPQQPQYYYQQQPQYYQRPNYQRRYSSSPTDARRKAQAAAEAKRKLEQEEKAKQEQEAAAAVPAPATSEASGIIDVAMKRKSGNLWVPAQINKAVTIDFVIDSGASDITLPRDVYLTLIRTGTLTKANYIGGARFGIADGSEVKGLKFKLASLQVGNQVLTDVVASVMPSDGATPLLGLSFLSRFQSWSVDNKSGTLKLVPLNAGTPAEAKPTQTAATAPQPLPEPPAAEETAAAAAAPAPAPAPTAAVAAAPTPASVSTVMPTATAEPKLAAATPGPRSGHVATSAFIVKEAPTAAAPAAETAPVGHPAVPLFPANTSYANARSSLLVLGYGPAPLPDAGKCDSITDATCFPERTSCAKADSVRCDYLWRRGDELIKVTTVAVPPTVAAVMCQVNCK